MDLKQMMGYGDLTIEEMVEKIQDPKTRMLAQMMLKQKETTSQPATDAADSATNRAAAPVDERLQQDVRKLISLHRQLLHQHEQLQARHQRLEQIHQYVADAMGACTCMGLDPACPTCQGAGKPGYREINEVEFGRLIQPFLELLINTTPKEETDKI